jgi:hypothetical protein
MPQLSKQPNRFYPSVIGIAEDPLSLTNALRSLKESVETHERRTPDYRKSFIRWEELVQLGIIDDDGNFILELDGGTTPGTGATELDELDDVTIVAPVDNDILGYNFATSQWTAQSAAELNLATLDDLVGIGGAEYLNDLLDVTITGLQTYDILYNTGSGWQPSMGAIQFDGTDLYILSDLNFFAEGGTGPSITNTGGTLAIDVPDGGLELSALTWVDVLGTNVRFPSGRGIYWTDSAASDDPYLRLLSSTVTVTGDPDYSDAYVIVNDWTAAAADSYGGALTLNGNVSVETTALPNLAGVVNVLDCPGASGDYVTIPNNSRPGLMDSGVNTNNAFIVEFWFKPASVAIDMVFMGCGGGGTNDKEWAVGWDSALDWGYSYWSSNGVGWSNTNSQGAVGIGNLTPNTWNHFALCKSDTAGGNGTTLAWYLNGVKQATWSQNVNGNDSTANLYIGGMPAAPGSQGQTFQGKLGPVRVYADVDYDPANNATYPVPTTKFAESTSDEQVASGANYFQVGNSTHETRIFGTSVQIDSPATEVTGTLDVLGNVDVTGNVTLTGTVDGRDVATDGATLDAHVALTDEHHVAHSGEVTGDFDALVLDVTAVSNRTNVAAEVSDTTIIQDATDGTLKKTTVDSITDAGFF